MHRSWRQFLLGMRRGQRTRCNIVPSRMQLKHSDKQIFRGGNRRWFHPSASLSPLVTGGTQIHRSNASCSTHRFHYFGTESGDPSGATANPNPTRVLLPTLGQNGTLVLRSNSHSIEHVQIVSQWRDDSVLEVLPTSSIQDGDQTDISHHERKHEIAIFDNDDSESSSSSPTTTKTFGRLRLKSHQDGITTSLGRKGTLIEVDVLNSSSSTSPDDDASSKNVDEPIKVIITVPEKSNITCQIANGDIDVSGKIEGDTYLSTSNGNISVSKIRGHNVTLDTTFNNADTTSSKTSMVGTIHVRKAIEARTVQINTQSRIRALMLNGSNVSIHVQHENDSGRCYNKLDDDDEGAIIDVGSMYVSNSGGVEGAPENEAQLIVDDTNLINDDLKRRGLVRVKSTHGHVMVHAKTTQRSASFPLSSEEQHDQQPIPLIDIGGVNGSCDVTLEASCSDTDTGADHSGLVTRVHFDSMTPESISTITTRGRGVGQTSITMDRKVETDVRLLSVANSNTALSPHLDAHSLTSDEMEDIQSVLEDVNSAIQEHEGSSDNGTMTSISIETDAYNSTWDIEQELPQGVEYSQGTMSNRSGEPDSRFDVRSRGKINIDGAASQALHGFRGKQQQQKEQASSPSPQHDSSTVMPLLAVATDGGIKLETLSWFGSIARRYGLEEEESRGVGRRASRSPRLDK